MLKRDASSSSLANQDSTNQKLSMSSANSYAGLPDASGMCATGRTSSVSTVLSGSMGASVDTRVHGKMYLSTPPGSFGNLSAVIARTDSGRQISVSESGRSVSVCAPKSSAVRTSKESSVSRESSNRQDTGVKMVERERGRKSGAAEEEGGGGRLSKEAGEQDSVTPRLGKAEGDIALGRRSAGSVSVSPRVRAATTGDMPDAMPLGGPSAAVREREHQSAGETRGDPCCKPCF